MDWKKEMEIEVDDIYEYRRKKYDETWEEWLRRLVTSRSTEEVKKEVEMIRRVVESEYSLREALTWEIMYEIGIVVPRKYVKSKRCKIYEKNREIYLECNEKKKEVRVEEAVLPLHRKIVISIKEKGRMNEWYEIALKMILLRRNPYDVFMYESTENSGWRWDHGQSLVVGEILDIKELEKVKRGSDKERYYIIFWRGGVREAIEVMRGWNVYEVKGVNVDDEFDRIWRGDECPVNKAYSGMF